MKPAMLILISAFLMAACAQNQGVNARHDGPAIKVVSGFFDDDDRTIEVTVTGEKPAGRIELVSPAGQVYRADRIDVTQITQRQAVQPSMGVGVFGGSSSGVGTAVGIGVPLSIGGDAASQSFTRSDASLTVGDIAAYRADWQRWQIRVSFDDPPRHVTTPAPEPP